MTRSAQPDPDDVDRLERLEAQLRAMPAPDVPDGLLSRLLRDVPDRAPGARPRKTLWLWWAGAAAAAAVMGFMLARDSAHRQPEPDASVSVEFVVFPNSNKQETDPCSILPPLADLPHSQPPS